MGLEIETYSQDGVLIIRLAGEMNSMTVHDAERTIMPMVSVANRNIAIDMAELTFLTSAGMRLLVTLLRETRRVAGDLRLARPQPNVEDVLRMGMADLIKVYTSLPSVIASYDAGGGEEERPSGTISKPFLRRWTSNFLDQMRTIGDPPADDTIADLAGREEIRAVNQLLKLLVTNDYVPPSELPGVVQTYLQNTTAIPEWADWSRIQRGQKFFERYGVQILAILLCGSLPKSYAARKGAHVLWMTQSINRNPYRRIIETSHMVLDVMTAGSLDQDGKGLRTAQKVRLVHAAVRRLMIDSGRWDMAAYDYPINQEDLAGTLMAFSYMIIEGLPVLGINLTTEQAEDYLHTWNVVGAMMGILPEMMPNTVDEAKMLTETILARQMTGGPEDNLEGRALTSTLVGLMQEMLRLTAFQDVPKALIRQLVGDETANLLGVEQTSWHRTLGSIRWANRVMDSTSENAIIGRVISVAFRGVMHNMANYGEGGERASFRMPTSF